ncbi:hypothetical protein L7F22_024282 [Adiantum nelumboides]|nr:hypothetical protein [Adiantum nelumboides]
MEEDVAPQRRRAQRSPTPTKRKRSPHSPPHHKSKKEEKNSKQKKERKRSPSSPSSSPSSSSDESGGYSSRESPRRGHRRSHATWRRSNKLKKFKEGGKSISFLTYDGTFGATDKVSAFIQQFDAAFGDEGFTESSKLCHVAMHFQKSTRQWWASLRANGEAPRTWKNLRASIMKQFISSDAKDKVLTEWQSLKLTPFESIHKYTPQQNGVAERKNRHIAEVAQALMSEKNMSPCYWVEAASTAVYTMNKTPTAAEHDMTLKEKFTGKKLDVSHFKVFGWTDVNKQVAKNSDAQSQVLSGSQVSPASSHVANPWSGKLPKKVSPTKSINVSRKSKEKIDEGMRMPNVTVRHDDVDGHSSESEHSLDEELGIPSVRTPGVRRLRAENRAPRGNAEPLLSYFFSSHHLIVRVRVRVRFCLFLPAWDTVHHHEEFEAELDSSIKELSFPGIGYWGIDQVSIKHTC